MIIRAALLFCVLAQQTLFAEEASESFAGQVTASRVRIRLEPNLDSHIFREAEQGELFIVVGEKNEFFAVEPPEGVHGYVFRTYVLDNQIEGNNVNVRLQPTLDAPIIAQLNRGDKVKARQTDLSDKWLQISPPEGVTFYISKDYVERMGDVALVHEQKKREREASHLLSSAYLVSQSELEKPFPEIDMDTLTAGFDKVLEEYADLSEESEKAEEAITLVQEAYLEKKVAFLESKAEQSNRAWEERQAELNDVVKSYQDKLADLERQMYEEDSESQQQEEILEEAFAFHNAIWQPIERGQFRQWKQRNSGDMGEFYRQEKIQAETLTGVLQPYTQPVKNKPGDFILVNRLDNRPIAYLYSTQVDLQDAVGREITVKGAPRPNNYFAFPAFHVISVE